MQHSSMIFINIAHNGQSMESLTQIKLHILIQLHVLIQQFYLASKGSDNVLHLYML